MDSPPSPTSSKADVAEAEDRHRGGGVAAAAEKHSQEHHRGLHHNKAQDEVERIDAAATAPGVTMESFAHLDEKKILRKVCLLAQAPHL